MIGVPKTAYLVTGNADTVAVSPTDFSSLGHRPGELGLVFEQAARQYQIVQLDSGVTSSTTGGIVAANDLAFWKDRSTYLVTKDPNQAEGALVGFYNNVAGVFRNAVPTNARVNGYGTVCCVLQKARGVSIKATGTNAIGDHVRANQSTPVADATFTTGTVACPTQKLGTFTSVQSGGVATVDLDIQAIP